MKKYIKPEMNIELFGIEDVITTSGELENSARNLKDTVNGKKGDYYGTQNVSIYA